MHAFNGAAVAVVQLFVIIGLGWLVAKKLPTAPTFPTEFWDKLARLVYVVFVPPLVFDALLATHWEASHARFAATTAIGSILAVALSAVLVPFLPRRSGLTDRQRATLLCAVFQPNAVFLGFPLILGVVGETGMPYAALFAAIEWPLTTVASIWLLQRHTLSLAEQARKIARDPLIIAIALGFVWSLCELPFPQAARKPLSLLGGVAAPTALVIVGARLALHDLKRHAAGIAWASAVKLVAIPLAMLALAHAFALPALPRNVFVLLMAAPIAASMTIIVQANDGDVELCANATSATTVASLATLVVWVLILV